jgi:dihydroneopterin aldolase
MDAVRIHGLELECIVGIRPNERLREQKVRLDIALHSDLRQAGRSGRIALTSDYSRVAREVSALLRFRRYHLIEMAAEELCAMLLGLHGNASVVRLCIEKPGALEGFARAASVEIRRTHRDFPPLVEAQSFGERALLLETRDARLERLRIAPGGHAELVVGADSEAVSWLSSGQLHEHGQPLLLGTPRSESGARTLVNSGPEAAVLFRCLRSAPPGAR